jgi:hypothetical protein
VRLNRVSPSLCSLALTDNQDTEGRREVRHGPRLCAATPLSALPVGAGASLST